MDNDIASKSCLSNGQWPTLLEFLANNQWLMVSLEVNDSLPQPMTDAVTNLTTNGW